MNTEEGQGYATRPNEYIYLRNVPVLRGTRHRHMLGHRYSYYVYSLIAKPLTKASGCITPTLTGGDEKRDEDEDEEE